MQKVRSVIYLLALSGILFITAHDAKAQGVSLVTGDNYYPYTDRRLPNGGLATTIVAAALQKMGLEPQVAFKPWQEGYEQTKAGRYIATFPYIRTQKRAKEFMFSRALFIARPSLFVNFEHSLRIVEIDDVINRSLCVPDGWAVDGYLRPYEKSGKITVEYASSMYDCFKMLKSGVVDMVSADSRMGFALAGTLSTDNWTKAYRFSPKGSPNYLMVSRNFPGAALWLEGFNNALSDIPAKEMQYLITNYFAQLR